MNFTPDDADKDYPEVLSDMADHTEKLLLDQGIAPEIAKRVARDLSEFMRVHWGGQRVYIAKGRAFQTRKLWQEVWEAFDGRNHSQLGRRFGLNVAQIYKIIEVMRRAESRRNQPDIFDEENDARLPSAKLPSV